MPDPIVEKAAAIYAAARRVFDAGLAGDGSAFTSGAASVGFCGFNPRSE
jgi:hypothetical protein